MFNFLGNYSTEDALENTHVQNTLAWLRVCPQPVNRQDFSPGHATASGIVVCRETQSVALIFHKTLQRWLQPGGHVEPSDPSIAHAAAREVLEEMGVVVDPLQGQFIDMDVHEIPEGKKGPAHLHFDFRYLFIVSDQPLHAADDVSHARWCTKPQAIERAADPGMLRILNKVL